MMVTASDNISQAACMPTKTNKNSGMLKRPVASVLAKIAVAYNTMNGAD